MKNTKLILVCLLLCQVVILTGQVKRVKTNVSIMDTLDIVVLSVFPDSFPNVSVLFKAETRSNEPVWDLNRNKMQVKENGDRCEVVTLAQISKNKAINLGVVFDHSGSMGIDQSQLYDSSGAELFTTGYYGETQFPAGYIAPIENAKQAVSDFIKSFNESKDYISLVAFSSIVDVKLSLSQDIAQIKIAVDSLRPTYSTALYDAMIVSIDEIKAAKGVKVLVVLTDGNDNSSTYTWRKVIKEANKSNIPIFIIGMGDVNVDTLQIIADSTKGQFYYTQSSKSLSEIYALISKQVQSFYNLVYRSPNFASADTSRQIELTFDIDSIYTTSSITSINLPKEVVVYMAKKEREKSYFIYGGATMVVVISAGVLLLYFRKKKNKSSD